MSDGTWTAIWFNFCKFHKAIYIKWHVILCTIFFNGKHIVHHLYCWFAACLTLYIVDDTFPILGEIHCIGICVEFIGTAKRNVAEVRTWCPRLVTKTRPKCSFIIYGICQQKHCMVMRLHIIQFGTMIFGSFNA